MRWRGLDLCAALISVGAGALAASQGRSWWAFALGSLGAFNVAVSLLEYRYRRGP